jgi:hypothetical protein
MLRLRVGSGRPYIQKAQGRHGNNSKSHNSLSLPNITCTPSCWPRRRRRGEKQWPEGFVPHTVWTREGWIGRLYKLHKMENTKKHHRMPKNRKILYNPKVSFPTLKENCCTPVQTLSFCVCVSSCVLFHEWNPGSNSDEKGEFITICLAEVKPRWRCARQDSPLERIFTWKVARRMEVARGDVSKEGRGDQTNYLWRPILLLFLQLFLFFYKKITAMLKLSNSLRVHIPREKK